MEVTTEFSFDIRYDGVIREEKKKVQKRICKDMKTLGDTLGFVNESLSSALRVWHADDIYEIVKDEMNDESLMPNGVATYMSLIFRRFFESEACKSCLQYCEIKDAGYVVRIRDDGELEFALKVTVQKRKKHKKKKRRVRPMTYLVKKRERAADGTSTLETLAEFQNWEYAACMVEAMKNMLPRVGKYRIVELSETSFRADRVRTKDSVEYFVEEVE